MSCWIVRHVILYFLSWWLLLPVRSDASLCLPKRNILHGREFECFLLSCWQLLPIRLGDFLQLPIWKDERELRRRVGYCMLLSVRGWEIRARHLLHVPSGARRTNAQNAQRFSCGKALITYLSSVRCNF